MTKNIPEQRTGTAGRPWVGADGDESEQTVDGFMEERGELTDKE